MADSQTAAVAPRQAPAPPADAWPEMLRVHATLSVEVPIVQLTVRELYRLEKGSVVASGAPAGENVPLLAGGKLIAWGEFQVLGDNIALRIAELA